MSLFQAIDETQACSDKFNGSFDALLTEHLPTDWIETSLTLSSHATIRRRRGAGPPAQAIPFESYTLPWLATKPTPPLNSE